MAQYDQANPSRGGEVEMNEQLKDLHERLGEVIRGTCNTIGCKDCGLKFSFDPNAECSATDLQRRIYDAEHALRGRE